LYGAITAAVWGRTSEITTDLFKKDGARQPTRFKTIDLPELHQQADKGREFIVALTDCPNDDFYSVKSV